MDTIRDMRGIKFGKCPDPVLYSKLSSNSKVVYTALDKFANNETAIAFPGLRHLAIKLHLGKSTVHRAIQELQHHRPRPFISVKKIPTHKGWRNEYTLLPLR